MEAGEFIICTEFSTLTKILVAVMCLGLPGLVLVFVVCTLSSHWGIVKLCRGSLIQQVQQQVSEKLFPYLRSDMEMPGLRITVGCTRI